MLMRMFFTEFLLAFCAVHLVSEAQAYIACKLAAYRRLSQRAVKRVKTDESKAVRGDWYVYFERSQLTGEKTATDRISPKNPRNGQRAPRGSRPAVRTSFARNDGRVPVRPSLRLIYS